MCRDSVQAMIDLFTSSRPDYPIEELIRVIPISLEELEAAITERQVDPWRSGDTLRFHWEDVKALILRRWTAGMLAKLLPPAVVPPLNGIERVTIELPAHQQKYLKLVAAKESAHDRAITPSDIVQRLIDELISSMEIQDWAEAGIAIPGFTDAVDWPLAAGER